MVQDTKGDMNRRRLRAGIVGGGEGAFIGSVHRIAAELDGQALVVAGALSSNPEKAKRSASAWRLDRSYDSFAAMAQEEAKRPDGIDFVIVAVPNHLHYAVSTAFLEAGLHVVCDKPMTYDLEQAEELAAGDSMLFDANVPHVYENPGGAEARYHDVIIYPLR